MADREPMPAAEFGFARTDLRRRLVAAILRGEKTSTTALLSDYQADGDPLPVVGERFRLIDELDRSVGVIETTQVWVSTIGQVDLRFAIEEGEGFTTVAEWRDAHERFWRSYQPPDWQPTGDTPIVCERFRLVEVWDPPR